MKIKNIIFIGLVLAFILGITLPGTVSAYTVSYSASGKIVDVKGATATTNYLRTTAYSSDKLKISGTSGFIWNSKTTRVNNQKATEAISGKLTSSVSFTGSAVYSTNRKNSQDLLISRVTTLKFTQSGKYIGTTTITEVPTLKYINGAYRVMKWTQTMKTTFSNGNIRSSTIIATKTRNKSGTPIGLSVIGTSSGKEKVNTTWAYYTGKVSIGTQYSKTKGYIYGNYHELKTSSSATLIKQLPYEALFFNDNIQKRGCQDLTI
jgi:hypothetical protein